MTFPAGVVSVPLSGLFNANTKRERWAAWCTVPWLLALSVCLKLPATRQLPVEDMRCAFLAAAIRRWSCLRKGNGTLPSNDARKPLAPPTLRTDLHVHSPLPRDGCFTEHCCSSHDMVAARSCYVPTALAADSHEARRSTPAQVDMLLPQHACMQVPVTTTLPTLRHARQLPHTIFSNVLWS